MKTIRFIKVAIIAALFFQGVHVNAQIPVETLEQKTKRMEWWTDARFGMFIHWGLYALPARHEWVKKRERISDEEYQKYFDLFNPDLYNPREWAKMAKNAGMKYNSRSIYGCTQAPDSFSVPDHSLLTYNPKTNRLYIHLLDYPLQNFTLKGYKGKVKYAQFLHDASEIKISAPSGYWSKQQLSENDINLSLPVNKPPVEIPVIELILND